MTDYSAPKAPKHLEIEGKRLWRTVCREWELEVGAEELVLLEHACNAQDMTEKAQKELEKAGNLTYIDRFEQPHERPELRIIRQSRAAVASLVKQIGQSQLSYRRLQQAEERHRLLQEKRDQPVRLDRRGGGLRRVS